MIPRSRSLRVAALPLVLITAAGAAFAQECVVPPTPEPVQVTQPGGATLHLRLRGTGFHSWYEDLDGHPVVETSGGFYYARTDAEGRLQATNLLVGRAKPGAMAIPVGVRPQPPASAGAPILPGATGKSPQSRGGVKPFLGATGTVDNLVVLLRFSNHGPGGQNRTLPSTADVGTIMNAVGGDPVLAPTGSVRDHYLEDSYGLLTIDSTVAAWVTVPGSETYYANGNSGLTSLTWDLITDGLDLVDALVDFDDFDADGDGVIDAITFLHSGYGAEWGGTDSYGTHYSDRMWSHKWSIPTWTSAEGVTVSDYNISPGLWATSGSGPGRIGVVAHELGHFFGLPDLYDTDGSAEGIGNWCLMAGGSWGFDSSQQYPSHMGAWAKAKMGWLLPETILPGSHVLPRVETNPTVYKIDSGYPPGEYLLVENRTDYGFNDAFPAEGLSVWHIDETKGSFGSNNPNTDEGYPGQGGWPGNGRHYRVALLQADDDYDLEEGNNRGDSGDLYRSGFVSSITSTTSPNTDAYQEGNIIDNGNAITGIGAPSNNLSMTLSNALAPTITTGTLPPANVGTPYSQSLSRTGGDAPFVWTEHLASPSYATTDLGSSLYTATGTGQNWNDDEDIWSLALPFEFPFYEGNYDTCYVSSNGFIEFAPTEPEPWSTPHILRASRRIAPLWEDLRTDGSGSFDVYIDTSVGGQIKIRWRGETYSGGNDVRFAVVLFDDGRIRFDYGSGNNGINPTVGISRGEGGEYQVPGSHNGASNLGNANSLLFTLSGSDLPDGLSLSTGGTLSGTPTAAGTHNPWFRVTDADHRYDLVQLTLDVTAGIIDCNNNGVDDATDISNGTSQDCNSSGIPDECELAGNDCNSSGVPDDCELVGNDCNSNGTPDDCELAGNDCNSNGVPDDCDTDCNSNGTPDDCESITDCNSNSIPDECELAGNDCDSNGVPDECDTDCNSNGTPDDCESFSDCNGNSVPDECELVGNDCNSTGVPDECELLIDCNSNGVPDECDPDCNNNLQPDDCESFTDCNSNSIPDECELAGNDCNSNGVPDECDTDCNASGTPDDCESITDCNSNSIPDECELAGNDCNSNGTPDDCELAGNDCNSNGTPDDCELAGNDCNSNGTPDECELAGNDCNSNSTPDDCELGGNDCNSNGVPDECDTDCNSNGTPDDCESFSDCNSNSVPDECELVGNDCNSNGAPDECDTDCNSNGTPDDCESFADCNSNSIPDECELAGNDCNSNGVPDECDTDCNASGTPDDCEAFADCNSNGTPDECDIAAGTSQDWNLDGIPDDCGPAIVYCSGDGSGTACPCGNTGSPGSGCANTASADGAAAIATGSSSISADDLLINGAGFIPGAPALLFSGLTQINGGNGNQFGDGLRCVGGHVTRMNVRVPDANGMATWGPGLAANFGWSSGETRTFQIWYRDTNGLCGSGFGLTNGLQITLTP